MEEAFKTNKGKLFLSSITTILGLYGVLIFLLIIIFEWLQIDLEYLLITAFIILAINFIISPFIMDLTLNFLYKIQWRNKNEIPEYVVEYIEGICRDKNIKFPKFGIIDDATPNAFTYGRTPNSARLIITKGTIILLSRNELKSVVAHEMGHIVHWDMLLMTAAQFVPLVTYYIFKSLLNTSSKKGSKKSDNSLGAALIIAIISYIIYIISEYIVLYFSRVREYYADRFSGESTGNPNDLASALVKIGIGVVNDKKTDNSNIDSISALGLCDEKNTKTLGIASYANNNPLKEFDEQTLKNVSKWDLWNPWATIYEINSTHPLIAKRLKNLGAQAIEMNKEPLFSFDERKPESYVDDFFKELCIVFLPWIALIIGSIFCFIFLQNQFLGIGVIVTLLVTISSSLLKTLYRYHGKEFNYKKIIDLLSEVKVSGINPISCRLHGKLIGKGTPGYIFSEDFTLQDESGIIFLDYSQPLAIWNSLFGLLKADKYVGKEVEVIGWYRRAPVPYIEIKELIVAGKTIKCYSYIAQIIAGIVALGVILILGTLFVL